MRGIGNMNTQGTRSDFAIKFDRLYATQKFKMLKHHLWMKFKRKQN